MRVNVSKLELQIWTQSRLGLHLFRIRTYLIFDKLGKLKKYRMLHVKEEFYIVMKYLLDVCFTLIKVLIQSLFKVNITIFLFLWLKLSFCVSPKIQKRNQNIKDRTWYHCPKTNLKFRDVTWNVKENMIILHEIFHVVSRFPRYISCYIAESWLPLGQCIAVAVLIC